LSLGGWEENPVIQEAMRRGLGEGDINRIEILGNSIENTRENIIHHLENCPKKWRRRSRKLIKQTFDG
jgi:hypothetical protein